MDMVNNVSCKVLKSKYPVVEKFHFGVRLKLLLKETLDVTVFMKAYVPGSGAVEYDNEYDNETDHGKLKSTNSAGFLLI